METSNEHQFREVGLISGPAGVGWAYVGLSRREEGLYRALQWKAGLVAGLEKRN